MGAVVIAVVFVVSLLGAPTLFGHSAAHASQSAQQQEMASAQMPAPDADAEADADADAPTHHP
jgi:Tfp pilus assembly protein PilV